MATLQHRPNTGDTAAINEDLTDARSSYERVLMGFSPTLAWIADSDADTREIQVFF